MDGARQRQELTINNMPVQYVELGVAHGVDDTTQHGQRQVVTGGVNEQATMWEAWPISHMHRHAGDEIAVLGGEI